MTTSPIAHGATAPAVPTDPVTAPRSGRAPWAAASALLVALQLAAQLSWLAVDRSPLGYEVPEHWLASEEISADMRETVQNGGSLVRCIGRHRQLGHRATAVHLYTAAWLAVRPGAWWPLALAIWTLGAACLVALAWAAYDLARVLAGPEAGAVAVAAITLAPPVWGFGRKLGVDLPLAVGVLLVARSLVVSRPWTRPRAAFGLGLLGGLGCLAKAQLLLWMPGLVVASAIAARRAVGSARALAVSALAMGIGLALGSTFFWVGALGEIASDASWSVAGPHTERAGWDVAALAYYPLGVWAWCGPALGSLGLLGLATWAWDATRRPRAVHAGACVVAVGAFAGFALWTAYPIRWVRYVLPSLPLLAVLAATGLARLPVLARRVLAGVAFAVAVAIELAASTGFELGLPAPEPAVMCHPPEPRDWRPAVSALARELGELEHGSAVGLVGPEAWPPDLYTLLEAHLRAHVPASTQFFRRSDLRDPDDLARFEIAAARFRAEVQVLQAGGALPTREGWRAQGPFEVYEIDAPDGVLTLWVWLRVRY